MTLPAIPAIDGDIPPQVRTILLAMKENIEVRGGQRKAGDGDKFSTTADVTAAAAVAAAATAVAATVVSTAESIAGTENTKQMTALRMREGFNAAGGSPVYACRAWVNFNGSGTVAIRASGNVSSITDNAASDWTVNFTTAMEDANYVISTSGSKLAITSGYLTAAHSAGSLAAGSARVRGSDGANGNIDLDFCLVAVFR